MQAEGLPEGRDRRRVLQCHLLPSPPRDRGEQRDEREDEAEGAPSVTITWNADWSHTRAHWPELFEGLGLVGKPNLRFMEIGSFEGQSARWTLENVLTDISSTLVMIDPLQFHDINGEDQLVRLERHLAPWFKNEQAELLGGMSETVLRGFDQAVLRVRWQPNMFDFVYIDGDHFPAGVLKDAVLAWPLLKSGGHLLFDDYVPELGGHRGPQPGIDAFVSCYEPEIATSGLVGVDQFLVGKR